MKRYISLLLLTITACMVVFSSVGNAAPYGLRDFEGYFHHKVGPYYGDFVLPPIHYGSQCPSGLSYCAIPKTVNSIGSFENFIINYAQHGDAWEKLGASFIIQTMLPTSQSSRNEPPTGAQITDWKNDVNGEAKYFRFFRTFSFNINTFCQNASGTADCNNRPTDDAFFPGSGTATTIELLDSKGNVIYAIKYECANPVGHNSMGHLTQSNQYANHANSTITYNGKTYTNVTAFPGQTVVFNHYIGNNGPQGDRVNWTTHDVEARRNLVSSSTYVNARQTIRVNWQTFTIPLNAIPGTKYCRYISFSPLDQNGGSGNGNTVCVTVGSNFNLTPSVNASSTTVDPGGSLTFTYIVYNGGSTYSTSVSCTPVGNLRGPGYTPLPQQDVARTSDPGYRFGTMTWSNPKCPRTFASRSTTTIATETYTVPTGTPVGDSVCRSLVLNPKGTSGGPVTSAEVCVVVVDKPYFSVAGGDVVTGAPMEINGADCTTVGADSAAGVVGWNQENGAYDGAGTQFAAIALRDIQDFATAQGTGGVAPYGLSFSNTTNVTGTNMYGGSFGSEPCVPDYFKPAESMTPNYTGNHTLAAADMNHAVYVKGGNLTIAGTTSVNNGTNTVVYVSGNVYINGSVIFTGSGNYAAGLSDVPTFSIIATGNIYIAPGVTELDGLYVAEPVDATNGGNIYTCTTAPFRVGGLTFSTTTYYNTCNKRLDVYGAFVAKELWPLRTHGTLSVANSPAEVFHYDPEAWLGVPSDVTAGGGNVGGYDAITSLPPVL